MTNTMMAFLAMMMMMFFSLNQNRAIVQTQREAASVELEVLATGIASQTMQYVASMPFDANMSQIDPQNPDLNLLTHPTEFPTGASMDESESLEDFNQMQPDTSYVSIGEEEEAETPILHGFKVQAVVDYIDDEGNVSETPTWTKEVTLYVEQSVPPGVTPFLRQPIVKKRRFSPKWGT